MSEEEYPTLLKNYNYVAGIIPLVGVKTDFAMEWPDSLMPVAAGLTALEQAVIEAVYAGCSTIWVVCNQDIMPLVRFRLGEWAEEPWGYISSAKTARPFTDGNLIPIFYTSLQPRDLYARLSYPWAILHGAALAIHTGRKISKWSVPDRFYVSSPFGIIPEKELKPLRRAIGDFRKDFYLTYDGKTALDGEYLSFTFNAKQYVEFKNKFNLMCHNRYKHFDLYRKENNVYYDKEESYSGRRLTIEEIFGWHKIEGVKFEPSWYYRIDNWEGYCHYLGSEHRRQLGDETQYRRIVNKKDHMVGIGLSERSFQRKKYK